MKMTQKNKRCTTERHTGHGSPDPYNLVPMPLKVNVPPLETSVVACRQDAQNPGCTKWSWHAEEQNVPY